MLVPVLVLAAALAAPVSVDAATSPAAAVPPLELAPGVRYDPAIPTLQQVLGHDFGAAISTPEEIVRYLEALHAAAPERTRLLEYARSWEGRPLVLMIVGSAERIARLDEIERGLRRLADPRGLAASEAEKLVAELPVAVWLLHAVHGNEISSSDAALAEAYHLLAAQGDATAQAIGRDALALIDPLENPDGRARFLAANGAGRAAEPDREPFAAEHDEPWPRGRSNHYLFDMNRDWFALSQPETRGRVAVGLRYFPQVAVDEHEMGGDATYYFAPPATPENPYITPAQHDWLIAFGRDIAARFDARGFAYFTREIFDSFYPGYGESWPMFHGAIGMTFEQASPRGLLYRRDDGDLLTYRQAVVHHFTSALSTLATAAAHREKLLRDFLAYRQSAIAEGERGPVRAYLLPPGGDPPRVERLARLLAAQGIEVRRSEQPVTLDEPASAGKPRAGANPRRALPAGTFVVTTAQPAGRLLRNLFEPSIPMDERFVREQDRRRQKRLPEQFYDLTGWSLPLAWDVEVVTTDRPLAAATVPFAGAMDLRSAATTDPLAPPDRGEAPLPAARVGYLVPWGVGAAAAVVEALQEELRASVADAPLTVGGVRYGAGTVLFRSAANPPDLPQRLGRILSRHGATAVALDSGWVEAGISLGSSDMRPLTAPRVVLAWDRPTHSTSAGWARYVLERRFGQPVTAVRTESLEDLDLARWDVVVLPAGDYGRALGEDGARRLADWVRAGGTLVTLGEASRWAARDKVGLLSTATELRGGKPDIEEKEKDKPAPPATPDKPFDLEKAIQPDREPPANVPGSLLRVDLDLEHWLAAGSDGEIQAVVESQRVFTPIKLDRGTNVGLYAPAPRLVASGLAWPEARDQLAQKAFLIDQPLGDGHVIAFAEDPNYRAFAEATELLFMNAVLFGPAH